MYLLLHHTVPNCSRWTDSKGAAPTYPFSLDCTACNAGLGFPIRWNRPAHTGLYDQPQAAESLRARRKPFCSRDKHIHRGFGHSSEGNTIVSMQLEKIGRVDHIAGD